MICFLKRQQMLTLLHMRMTILLTYLSKTSIDIRISNTEIANEEKAKLLGVNLEGRLNFGFHGNRIKSN